MNDLTCIFLTLNKLPKEWQEYHKKTFLEAIGDTPLITVSREPMDIRGIQIRQTEEQSHSNIFKQMLIAAKIATTPYIAIIEDDILYSKEHFLYRPALDTFAYNMSRWSTFTWDPIYSHKMRKCNGAGIFPREEAIKALEERFARWKELPHHLAGELGFKSIEQSLGVKVRKSENYYTTVPVIQFFHEFGTHGGFGVERLLKRKHSNLRALDVPHWGKAEELVKNFK